jgi:hypothetical protein
MRNVPGQFAIDLLKAGLASGATGAAADKVVEMVGQRMRAGQAEQAIIDAVSGGKKAGGKGRGAKKK